MNEERTVADGPTRDLCDPIADMRHPKTRSELPRRQEAVTRTDPQYRRHCVATWTARR